MSIPSVNPCTGDVVETFAPLSPAGSDRAIERGNADPSANDELVGRLVVDR